MPCGFFDPLIPALWAGSLNVATDTYKIVMLDTDLYTYSATHEFLSSIPVAARVATGTLQNVAIAGRAMDADDITLAAVSGATVEAFAIYQDTGNAATSRLVMFSDVAATLPFTPNGGDVTFQFDSAAERIAKL